MHHPPLGPVLALVFNAFVWGVSWWPFRQLEAAGLHPLWATALVFALATALIGAAHPRAFVELWRAPVLWILVLAAGSTNAAFNWGVTIGDVVRVVLLFYLMPLWAVVLARLLLHERLDARAALRVALALAGAAVVLWPADGGWPLPRNLGEVLGVVGGFCFALNNVMLRREAHRPESARAIAMFIGGALVAGVLAAVLTVTGEVPTPPVPQSGWVLGALGLGLTFIGSNFALQYGAARLPAHTTAVVMLTELLFAAVSAFALGADRFTWRLLAGGALIVGAAMLAARPKAR